jgi:hypothetical protein
MAVCALPALTGCWGISGGQNPNQSGGTDSSIAVMGDSYYGPTTGDIIPKLVNGKDLPVFRDESPHR